jgi:hypothetical protein
LARRYLDLASVPRLLALYVACTPGTASTYTQRGMSTGGLG